MGRNNGSGLYRFDAASGHAFIQVDNTTVVANGTKRDSVSCAAHHATIGILMRRTTE